MDADAELLVLRAQIERLLAAALSADQRANSDASRRDELLKVVEIAEGVVRRTARRPKPQSPQ